jgi:hypothetical protein
MDSYFITDILGHNARKKLLRKLNNDGLIKKCCAVKLVACEICYVPREADKASLNSL